MLLSTEKVTDFLQAENGEALDDATASSCLFGDSLKRGLEGLVIKRIDSPYQAVHATLTGLSRRFAFQGAMTESLSPT